MLDIGEVITEASLLDCRDDVLALITHKHPLVAGSSKRILLNKVYVDPDTHWAFLLALLEDSALTLPVRGDVLWAMTYGIVARRLSGQRVESEWREDVFAQLRALWLEDCEARVPGHASGDLGAGWLLEHNIFGLLLVEALERHESGSSPGSATLGRLLLAPGIRGRAGLAVMFSALEKLACQGWLEFGVRTMLREDVRHAWMDEAMDLGIQSLANMRALNQEAVDGPLRCDGACDAIWSSVRDRPATLDPAAVWATSYRLWVMVGTGVNSTIMKFSGMALLALALSQSEHAFLERAISDLVGVILKPDALDVFHIECGKAHDPDWKRYTTLAIDSRLAHDRAELHEYYRPRCEQAVRLLGKGRMYVNGRRARLRG